MIVQNYKSIIRKLEKNTNMFTLNNILFYITNVSVKKWGIKKYLETNKIGSTVFQNLWDAAKAILRGKFIVIQSYLKKQEKHETVNLTLHLKQLEKEFRKKQN